MCESNKNHSFCSASTAKGVDYIYPSLAEFALVVVSHWYIDTILVLNLRFHLLETLILEVEAVFQKTILQILGDIIE